MSEQTNSAQEAYFVFQTIKYNFAIQQVLPFSNLNNSIPSKPANIIINLQTYHFQNLSQPPILMTTAEVEGFIRGHNVRT